MDPENSSNLELPFHEYILCIRFRPAKYDSQEQALPGVANHRRTKLAWDVQRASLSRACEQEGVSPLRLFLNGYISRASLSRVRASDARLTHLA